MGIHMTQFTQLTIESKFLLTI